MTHLNTNSNQPSLSKALEIAIENLENLRREGLITRYEQGTVEEEGVYHLTAYTKYPEKVDRELGRLSASISIEFGLPFYILVSREIEKA
jgi:macrodomain Ter protein organizer (MatP/YcbG family)